MNRQRRLEPPCKPYEHRYLPGIEDKLVGLQGEFFWPYDLQCLDSSEQTDSEHVVVQSEAHDSVMRGSVVLASTNAISCGPVLSTAEHIGAFAGAVTSDASPTAVGHVA